MAMGIFVVLTGNDSRNHYTWKYIAPANAYKHGKKISEREISVKERELFAEMFL
jgi:secreted PhoX family phosphatase